MAELNHITVQVEYAPISPEACYVLNHVDVNNITSSLFANSTPPVAFETLPNGVVVIKHMFKEGDLWYNTDNFNTYAYDGHDWVPVIIDPL